MTYDKMEKRFRDHTKPIRQFLNENEGLNEQQLITLNKLSMY